MRNRREEVKVLTSLHAWRIRRRLRSCDKVMVVAHPDDEVLWGGATLAAEDGWAVVCVTNASTSNRRRRFLKAMEVLDCQGFIFDIPDRRIEHPTVDEGHQIARLLEPFLANGNVKKIVTHSPDGETGHRMHQAVSRIVTDLAGGERLHYFSFDPTLDLRRDRPRLWEKKKAALEIYFNSLENAPGNDALHVKLSVHESPVRAMDYRRPNDLVLSIYRGSSVPAGSIEKGIAE